MANDLNQVSLIGRITRDQETKFISNGTANCKISIAVNRVVKKDDKWTDEVSFFDCNIWGKTAENLGKYLLKGKQVAISGELRQNRWEKDGQKMSKVEINVSTIQLIGDSKKSDETAAGTSDEEIPF